MLTERKEDTERSPMARRVNWEMVAASAAVISALASTLLGLYGIRLAREGIELTRKYAAYEIQPALEFLSGAHPAGEGVFLSVKNVGLGPARVSHFRISRAGRSLSVEANKPVDLDEFAAVTGFDEVRAHANGKFINYSWLLPGSVVGANEEIALLRDYQYSNEQERYRDAMQRAQKRFWDSAQMVIGYCSLDGSGCFEATAGAGR